MSRQPRRRSGRVGIVRPTLLPILWVCLIAAAFARATGASESPFTVRPLTWADVTAIHAQLTSQGIAEGTFATRVDEIRRTNARRVREGDLDHLIFYLLQSTRFTSRPAIEPALSAKAFVDTGRIPDDARARMTALLEALNSDSGDQRLTYFREVVEGAFPDRAARAAAMAREYERVMRFIHEKEFVAQRSPRAAEAVADLYQTRGLSTDSAVEAGYLVHQGLGVVKGLSPGRRIRRVLIVGPGLDIAPRTGMIEESQPESYQPWAVIDALLGLGLSTAGSLEVVAADINLRVVEHLRRSMLRPPMLMLASGIEESDTITFAPDYREYFARLGNAIGTVESDAAESGRRLRKRVRVQPEVVGALRPIQLDVVTERIVGVSKQITAAHTVVPPQFDLVIATNILPYFGDLELTLAMSNVAAMLAPGGVFLHNEPRLSLAQITMAVGLRFEQLRHATIARVRNGPPLVDTVFIHTRSPSAGEPKQR